MRMEYSIPTKAADLLSVYAPQLNKQLNQHQSGDTWYVIGYPLIHLTRNALAITIRHAVRTGKRVASKSGNSRPNTIMRHTTRLRYSIVARLYAVYIVDMDADTVTTAVPETPDGALAERTMIELKEWWTGRYLTIC